MLETSLSPVMVVLRAWNRLLDNISPNLHQEGWVAYLLRSLTRRPTIAPSSLDFSYHTRIIEPRVINLIHLFLPGSQTFIGFYWLCPMSSSIRPTMLRPWPFPLIREYPSSSAPQGIGLDSRFLAYWLLSAWHISCNNADDASSPT